MTALIWALVGYGDRGQRALGGLRASLLRCRGFSCILPAALEAVAVAVHLQDVDVVGEAVKQSAGEPLGSEDIGPLVEGEVGADLDSANANPKNSSVVILLASVSSRTSVTSFTTPHYRHIPQCLSWPSSLRAAYMSLYAAS